MGGVLVGTCGFCMPPKEYFDTFDVVELPCSFFAPAGLAAAQRLRDTAPESFEFTLKAPRMITDGAARAVRRRAKSGADRTGGGPFRDTPEVRKAWRRTLELAQTLDAAFVVFQCPSTFRPTAENIDRMKRFFRWAHRGGLHMGLEPRGAAWPDDLVWDLCRELSLTHVVHPFHRLPLRGRPPYYRFHGIGGFRHAYTAEELAQLRSMLIAPSTYCLFNNGSGGDDARRLIDIVRRD